MLSARTNHTAVSISNKMSLIEVSNDFSEIFNSVTRKFYYIKTLPEWVRTSKIGYLKRFVKSYQAASIGYETCLFQKENDIFNVYRYDVIKNLFSLKCTSMEMKSLKNSSCIKVPLI